MSMVVRETELVDVDPVYTGLLYCKEALLLDVTVDPIMDREVVALAEDVTVLLPSFNLTVFALADAWHPDSESLDSCPFAPIKPAGIVTLRAVTSAPKYPVTAPPTLKFIAALPGPLVYIVQVVVLLKTHQ